MPLLLPTVTSCRKKGILCSLNHNMRNQRKRAVLLTESYSKEKVLLGNKRLLLSLKNNKSYLFCQRLAGRTFRIKTRWWASKRRKFRISRRKTRCNGRMVGLVRLRSRVLIRIIGKSLKLGWTTWASNHANSSQMSLSQAPKPAEQ